MLKTADATAPAETHADSINKGAIEKNRKAVQPAHARAQEVTESYQFAFSKLQTWQPPQNQHPANPQEVDVLSNQPQLQLNKKTTPQTRNAKSSAGELFISSEALRNG
jgi:hypothetical protein